MLNNPTDLSFFSSFVTLFEESTALGDGILSNADHCLPICDKALVDAQKDLLKSELIKDANQPLSLKPHVHARMTGV